MLEVAITVLSPQSGGNIGSVIPTICVGNTIGGVGRRTLESDEAEGSHGF